jgi:hypothetical protein
LAMLERPGNRDERPLSLLRRTMTKPFEVVRRSRAEARVLDHDLVLETLRHLHESVAAFDHMKFTELTLHEALELYFPRPIGYELIPDHRSAIVRRVVRREGIHAELVYNPVADSASIKIAASLHQADRKEAHYHELAHLLAAHPVPYWVPGTPLHHRKFWHPSRSLCRRALPFDLGRCETDPALREEMIQWCERDADIWVEHLRAISALGRQVYLREERVIGL